MLGRSYPSLVHANPSTGRLTWKISKRKKIAPKWPDLETVRGYFQFSKTNNLKIKSHTHITCSSLFPALRQGKFVLHYSFYRDTRLSIRNCSQVSLSETGQHGDNQFALVFRFARQANCCYHIGSARYSSKFLRDFKK